jgi:hypothetical protein
LKSLSIYTCSEYKLFCRKKQLCKYKQLSFKMSTVTVLTGKFEIYYHRLIFVIVYLLKWFLHYIFNIYCILAATECQLSSLSHNRHNLNFFKCRVKLKHPVSANYETKKH